MIEPSLVEVVLYHANCNDGFGAAYSAWKLLGNRAEYIACSHGTPPPDVTGKKVVCLETVLFIFSIFTRAVVVRYAFWRNCIT